jgi:PTS system nitrogen regulatory IIA component
MKISDLLSPEDVMIDVRASNKRKLLQELAAKAASSLGLGVDQVAPDLLKREDLGPLESAAVSPFRMPGCRI